MEVWKDCKHYEGLYQVSSEGRVWNIRLQRYIKPFVKDNGYLVTPLNNNNSKSFLPRFYTKEEFIKNAFNVHKAVRVSKNI